MKWLFCTQFLGRNVTAWYVMSLATMLKTRARQLLDVVHNNKTLSFTNTKQYLCRIMEHTEIPDCIDAIKIETKEEL